VAGGFFPGGPVGSRRAIRGRPEGGGGGGPPALGGELCRGSGGEGRLVRGGGRARAGGGDGGGARGANEGGARGGCRPGSPWGKKKAALGIFLLVGAPPGGPSLGPGTERKTFSAEKKRALSLGRLPGGRGRFDEMFPVTPRGGTKGWVGKGAGGGGGDRGDRGGPGAGCLGGGGGGKTQSGWGRFKGWGAPCQKQHLVFSHLKKKKRHIWARGPPHQGFYVFSPTGGFCSTGGQKNPRGPGPKSLSRRGFFSPGSWASNWAGGHPAGARQEEQQKLLSAAHQPFRGRGPLRAFHKTPPGGGGGGKTTGRPNFGGHRWIAPPPRPRAMWGGGTPGGEGWGPGRRGFQKRRPRSAEIRSNALPGTETFRKGRGGGPWGCRKKAPRRFFFPPRRGDPQAGIKPACKNFFTLPTRPGGGRRGARGRGGSQSGWRGGARWAAERGAGAGRGRKGGGGGGEPVRGPLKTGRAGENAQKTASFKTGRGLFCCRKLSGRGAWGGNLKGGLNSGHRQGLLGTPKAGLKGGGAPFGPPGGAVHPRKLPPGTQGGPARGNWSGSGFFFPGGPLSGPGGRSSALVSPRRKGGRDFCSRGACG